VREKDRETERKKERERIRARANERQPHSPTWTAALANLEKGE